jgi:ribosome-binding ATPase YchF (GTP1/OBG family)
MKVSLFGVLNVPVGKHKVKDPRLDQVHKLIEADKKVYALVDVVGDDEMATADAIVTNADGQLELIFKDIEFVEARLEHGPSEAEKAVLLKIKSALEGEKGVLSAGLSEEELKLVDAHAFQTFKPVLVVSEAELGDFDAFLPKVVAEAGYFSFCTVGGTENRAWLIKRGATAPEAAAAIHTDMQKNFIRAEIISFADLVATGGEVQAKRANKLRLEQKPYVMQDYDITNFRINK